MLQRLQKILSAQGIASRRKAEEYIVQGLVKVNGKIAELGQKADPETDTIEVNGKILEDRKEMAYYVMNKPVGVETSNIVHTPLKSEINATKKTLRPRSGRERQQTDSLTVRDILPKKLQGKVFPVGRLDKDSCGLLLFTNDGVLSYRLTHPKFHHEKEYEVTLDRPMNMIAMKQLEEGFVLDGSMTKPLQVRKVLGAKIRVTLTEGRNRQIRRMCQNVGYTVKELKRVRIMNIEDEKLKEGQLRALTDKEKQELLQSVLLTKDA